MRRRIIRLFVGRHVLHFWESQIEYETKLSIGSGSQYTHLEFCQAITNSGVRKKIYINNLLVSPISVCVSHFNDIFHSGTSEFGKKMRGGQKCAIRHLKITVISKIFICPCTEFSYSGNVKSGCCRLRPIHLSLSVDDVILRSQNSSSTKQKREKQFCFTFQSSRQVQNISKKY